MTDQPQPPKGSMRLYDARIPPLVDGSYRVTVESELQKGSFDQTLSRDRFFTVDGPRFSLDPSLVAGVYPPRNAHGAYADSIPEIVISRRTLPWERTLSGVKAATEPPDVPAPTGQLPWVALIVLAEGEYTLLPPAPLEQVLSASEYAALDPAPAAGIRCEAVGVDADLLAAVLPSRDEIQVLTHIRQVNVEDRELNVSRGDGWFAVVMANRLPAPGLKNRAFLVSLEGRGDLIAGDPPPEEDPRQAIHRDVAAVDIRDVTFGRDQPGGQDVAAVAPLLTHLGTGELSVVVGPIFRPPIRLVVLHHWEFTVEGDHSFMYYMQNLDVGMLGATGGSTAVVSDSGHVAVTLHDRAGEMQTAWYRGPLVPYQLTRDSQGPYHSADQARRATPDTGVEDITYSAAFELGRLLAAADGRLAQELMRWRRGGYRASARTDVVNAVISSLPSLPSALRDHLLTALPPALTTGVACQVATGVGPRADLYGLRAAQTAIGFDPTELSAAWALNSVAEATLLLRGEGEVAIVDVGTPPPATVDGAAADQAGLQRLTASRAQVLDNARGLTEGQP